MDILDSLITKAAYFKKRMCVIPFHAHEKHFQQNSYKLNELLLMHFIEMYNY